MAWEGAAGEFQNALKIDPNFAPAYRELAEVFYLQKKIEDAKTNYKKYLELSKNNASARLRYASFLYFSKSYPEALAELNQITKVDSRKNSDDGNHHQQFDQSERRGDESFLFHEFFPPLACMT